MSERFNVLIISCIDHMIEILRLPLQNKVRLQLPLPEKDRRPALNTRLYGQGQVNPVLRLSDSHNCPILLT